MEHSTIPALIKLVKIGAWHLTSYEVSVCSMFLCSLYEVIHFSLTAYGFGVYGKESITVYVGSSVYMVKGRSLCM